jgi:hypothetical protein
VWHARCIGARETRSFEIALLQWKKEETHMFTPATLDILGSRVATGLMSVLFACACGAVDPSATDELDVANADSAIESQSEALTPDDGRVQAFSMATKFGDPIQIAYTHNGAKFQLDTTVAAGKAILSAPLVGTQRGQATLTVSCVNANGVSNTKTKTAPFDVAAGGIATYTAACDPLFKATKSTLLISPSDGIGPRVTYGALPVPPTASRGVGIQVAPTTDGNATSSYHFVKYGTVRLDADPAVEKARFTYKNETNQLRKLDVTYRIKCSGAWNAVISQELVVGPNLPQSLIWSCPNGQQLKGVETFLENIR